MNATAAAPRSRAQSRLAIAILSVLALVFSLVASGPVEAAEGSTVDVIVVETTPASTDAESLVARVGGAVTRNLAVIGGFAATIPASAVGLLEASASVEAVTANASLQLSSAGWTDGTGVDPNPASYDGSVNRVSQSILQVQDFWTKGATGQGIDVALIDSGVVPVNGLTYPGKVVNGPDLSFESQSDRYRYLDTFGHGTHMAGIIAGRDDGAAIAPNGLDFLGVAPGARIVSLKVAGHDGATDVSQVIAAIDWAVQHRNDNGLNIRVLNLSFGTDSVQPYVLDPLAFAVEQAWKAGIVVVVAAGNDGNGAQLRNPASDPFVIAVGATNKGNTRPKISSVMDFSNCGTVDRYVDVVVPGESIAGLASPGSSAYDNHPQSVVGGRYMLGSGTSQAAAFVSGAAALILSQRPELTPDQVKALLKNGSSDKFRKTDARCFGAGLINLSSVQSSLKDPVSPSVQTHVWSTGLGSLEATRGSDHIEMDGVALEGEQDIFGTAWEGTSWSQASASGTSWSGGDWNGTSWSGTSWSGTSWSGTSWSGTSWSGTSWSGTSWSGTSWSDKVWSGTSWSGTSWSGTSWSGTSWSGASWSCPMFKRGQSWG